MSQKFLTSIDLNQNELLNAVIQNLGTAPTSPVEGQIYFDDTVGDKALYVWNGTTWVNLQDTGAGTLTVSDGTTTDNISIGTDTLTISGGTALTSVVTDNTITVNLDNTAVTAASYGSASAVATFTVDAQGRLTAASSTTISITSSQVTDFTESTQDVVGAQIATNGVHTGISASYDDANDGAIDLSLTTTGVTASSYGSASAVATFTVDAYGRLTAASSTTISITSSQVSDLSTNAVTSLTGTANEVEVSGSTGAVTVGLPNDVTIGNDLTVTTDLDVGGNAVITGNLTVNGTTTTISTTNTVVEDTLLELGNGTTTAANDSGIVIERGSTGDNVFIGWDESADKFIMGTTTATGASTGDLSITAGTLIAALEGNADTATALETARTIGGVSFDGTANIDLPGVNTTGNQDTSGNAATATALETGRTINGVTFDGTANITVTAAAGTLTGTELNSTVVTSSLTSVGTISSGTWNGSTIGIAYGGTGATTAAGARDELAETSTTNLTTSTPTLARVSAQNCAVHSNNVSTTTVTHNFGTRDVQVQIYDTTTYEEVQGDVVRTDTNTVTVTLAGAISAGDYRIVVTG